MGKRSREKKERKVKGETKPRPKKESEFSSVCLRIINWGVYLVLFTPLIISSKYFFPFVGPKSIYFMGLVEIIFAAYLLLIILRPEYRPRLNIVLIALIVFVAVLILSSVFGVDLSRSFWSKYERMTGLLMWFHLLAFFVVLSSVFKREEDWLKIFRVSVFAAILMSLVGLLPRIGIDPLGTMGASTRGGATIGNSSFFGTYLLFNIFLALYLILKSTGGLRVYSEVSLAITSLALFLSDARAAILSTLGGLFLLFAFWLIFFKKRELRLVGIFLVASLIIFILCFIFFSFQPDSFASKIIEGAVGKTFGGRLVVWQGGWEGFLERPWLGWGPENYELVFTKYFNPCMFMPECGREVWYDRAHNIIFDTLVTVGVIGLLSYLGIFISVFYILWQRYFRKMIGFWTAGIFSMISISYFIQNLTVFDMVNSYMMFLLVLGFVGSLTTKRDEIAKEMKFTSKTRWLVAIVVILFCLSFFKFTIQPLKTDTYVIKAMRTQNPTERISLYKETLEASPVGKYQIREFFGDAAVNFLQSEAAKKVSIEDIKKEFNFVTQELEKSVEESPLDFRTYLKLGQIYNIYARLDSTKLSAAERILDRAIELGPTNQQGYWALAQTKLYQKKEEEALLLVEKAVELEPRLDKAHLVVVQVAQIMGDQELAKQKAKEAVEIIPSLYSELKELLEE